MTLGFSMNDDTMAGEGGSAEKAEAAEDPKGLLPTFTSIAYEMRADVSGLQLLLPRRLRL